MRSVTHFKGDFEACRLDIWKKKKLKTKASLCTWCYYIHPQPGRNLFPSLALFFPPLYWCVWQKIRKSLQCTCNGKLWASKGADERLNTIHNKIQYVVSFRWKCLENFHNETKMFLLLFYCQLLEILDTCDLILAIKS